MNKPESITTNFIKESSLGIGLPIDDLIILRRKQGHQLHAFNEAWDEWKAECAAKKWWQSKPPCPSIMDYCHD